MKYFNLRIASVALMIMMGVTSFAHDFEVKNDDGVSIFYKRLTDNKLAVTYCGNNYKNYASYKGNVVIPKTVLYNNIEYSVTAIGDYAFYGCSNLRAINIPDSLTSIGDYAFYNCNSLDSVIVSDLAAWCSVKIGNNTLFPDHHLYIGENKEITDLAIPDGVTTISKGVFSNCSHLTSVTYPSSVTNIGSSAFMGCTGLKKIIIPDSIKSIGDSAFYNCFYVDSVIIGKGLIEAAHKSFAGLRPSYLEYHNKRLCPSNNISAQKLEKLIIGDEVESIPAGSFRGCYYLTTVYIGKGLTNVEYALNYNSFSGCRNLTFVEYHCEGIGCWFADGQKSLKEVVIGDEVTWIGANAFSNCTELTSIEMPAGIDYLGDYAFKGCTGLTSIEVPAGVETIGEYAFSDCTSLTSIGIPDRVKFIHNYAFRNCTGLSTIRIPFNAEYVGEYAFDGCTGLTSMNIQCKEIGKWIKDISSLTSLTIGDSVETIVDDVLKKCTNLTSVEFHSKKIGTWFKSFTPLTEITIGDEVEAIDDQAFSGCYKLASVKLGANNRKMNIGYMIFSGCNSLNSPVYNDHQFLFMPTNYKGEYAIPSSISSIAGYAFLDCVGLNSITLSDSISYVGMGAFQGTGITAPVYNKNIFAYLPPTIKGTYTIPNGITTIAGGAFASTELTSIKIPNSVTTIGEFAFSGSTLPAIEIPNSVTTIGKGAFYWTGLKTIKIPCSVKVIEDRTFEDCEYLTTVILSDSLVALGENAFANCTILDSLTIGKGYPIIAKTAFLGDENLRFIEFHCDRIEKRFYAKANLHEIIIGDEVKHININVFENYKGLEKIIVGRRFPSIGNNAFRGCTALNYIEFHCDTISTSFNETNVKNVVFCEGVEVIMPKAFSNCKYLTNVSFDNCVPTIDANTFPTTIKNVFFPACAYDYFLSVFESEKTYYPQIKSFHEWMPYCATASYEIPNGIEAYIISGIAGNKAVLKKVTTINEGQGVLLKFNTDNLGVVFRPAFCKSAPMDYNTNLLKGVSETTEIFSADGEYTNLEFTEIDGNVCFSFVTESIIPAYKAYLQVPTTLLPSPLPSSFSTIHEGETGIMEISSKNKSDEGWYTQGGSHIIKPTRSGLFVRQNKKILVK
jgi:hypothetical protein